MGSLYFHRFNKNVLNVNVKNILARDSYWRGRLSTIDLLVLTSLDQLLFLLKILFSCFTKWANLMKRSMVLSLPAQLVFPALALGNQLMWNPCEMIKCMHAFYLYVFTKISMKCIQQQSLCFQAVAAGLKPSILAWWGKVKYWWDRILARSYIVEIQYWQDWILARLNIGEIEYWRDWILARLNIGEIE